MLNKDLKNLINSDLYRITEKTSLKTFIKALIFSKGFKICLFYRLCHYFYSKNAKFLLFIFKIFYRFFQTRYCIDLPYETEIGKGLYLGHVFSIVVSTKAKLGNNVNLSQNVTIGYASRGKNKGYPTIGNDVYIGPGAIIIGNIKIGNNVAIGANAVVTKDIPNNAVAVGVPANVVSFNGSTDYIIKTEY